MAGMLGAWLGRTCGLASIDLHAGACASPPDDEDGSGARVDNFGCESDCGQSYRELSDQCDDDLRDCVSACSSPTDEARGDACRHESVLCSAPLSRCGLRCPCNQESTSCLLDCGVTESSCRQLCDEVYQVCSEGGGPLQRHGRVRQCTI
jgi:hypothetical protein